MRHGRKSTMNDDERLALRRIRREQTLDALLERAERERLVEVRVRSRFPRTLETLLVPRDEDHRNAHARAARGLHQLLAGDEGHEHVGDDEVDRALLDEPQGFASV